MFNSQLATEKQRKKLSIILHEGNVRNVLKSKYTIQTAIAKVNCNKQVYTELFAFILSVSAFRIPSSACYFELYTTETKFKVKTALSSISVKYKGIVYQSEFCF